MKYVPEHSYDGMFPLLKFFRGTKRSRKREMSESNPWLKDIDGTVCGNKKTVAKPVIKNPVFCYVKSYENIEPAGKSFCYNSGL
jgi:hypothetical protein